MPAVAETACYHCGLPVADPARWTVLIQGRSEAMCCPGCQTVAGAIVAGGLENYYQFRSEPAVKAEDSRSKNRQYFATYDDPVFQQTFVRSVEGFSEAQLLIEDIHCAACCWLIEQALKKIPHVSISVNLASHKALLRWDQKQHRLSDLLLAIDAVGYHPSAYQINAAQQLMDKEHRTQLLRLGIAGIAMMQAMMFAIALYSGDFSAIEGSGMNAEHRQFMRWFSLLVTLPVMCYSALPFYKGAWRSLKSAQAGMDVSISLALVIAFIASLHAVIFKSGDVYFDSISMFVFLLLLARFFESNARRYLLGVQSSTVLPQSCLCLTEPGMSSKIETVAVNTVSPGDVIRVRAGESIPLDGVIIDGSSSVNESAFTGEQKTVAKKIGDPVYAATINGDGVLTIRVSNAVGHTRLDMITRLSEWSQAQKPRVSIMADKLASVFTLFVLALAMVAGVYWYNREGAQAFSIVLSILVVSCPCALSLATPAALAFCYQALRVRGVLITSSNMIEQLENIDRVIFDKTGTLTCGNFSIAETHLLSAVDKRQALEISAALEKYSEHPIASAFQSIATDIEITQVKVFSGKGIEGIRDDKYYRIGSREFCLELVGVKLECIPSASSDDFFQIIYLATKQEWLACFHLKDALRPEAFNVIRQLQDSGKQVEILSGDSSGFVEKLAKQLHVDHFRGQVSPEQKLEYISQLQAQGCRVLMVGDGINDVPVLAKANVSIAMSSASDMAKVKADAILLNNSLQAIVAMFAHCEKTRRIIKQNILWALLYNAIALPLAAMGLVPPWLAAAGMSLSSLWVTFNSLRLRK